MPPAGAMPVAATQCPSASGPTRSKYQPCFGAEAHAVRDSGDHDGRFAARLQLGFKQPGFPRRAGFPERLRSRDGLMKPGTLLVVDVEALVGNKQNRDILRRSCAVLH
jgi:hypothetical protein